jgi:hypothetical protein
MTDTVVYVRDPLPPHGVRLQVGVGQIKVGHLLMREGAGSFLIPRSEGQFPEWAHLLHAGAMLTVERTEGARRFGGFVRRSRATVSDAQAFVLIQDHSWFLKKALTLKSGRVSGAAHTIIRDTLAEMDARSAPPLLLSLEALTAGPSLDYTYQAHNGLDFLNTIARFTGWEWGFAYEVSEREVRTLLTFTERQGFDRRGEVLWEEGKHLLDVAYEEDADGYAAATVAVGGTGAVASRPAATVNRSGAAGGGVTDARRLVDSPGFGVSPALQGTRIMFDQTVTESPALFAAAERMHNIPENVAEALSFSIVESQVDMKKLRPGDFVRARLRDVNLGLPLERAVRVMSITLDPESGVHPIESQVRPEMS